MSVCGNVKFLSETAVLFTVYCSLLDSVVERVLQFVIEEAYRAIREVQTASVEQLEKITSVTPVRFSACLCYRIITRVFL